MFDAFAQIGREAGFRMNDLSLRLTALRKEHKLTKKAMAEALGLSRQTVSNWEKGDIEPNIGVLAKIASYFGVSTDYLLGHETYTTHYEEKYRQEDFYWGKKINPLAYEMLKLMPPTRPLRLLDVGCGEGQAAVFFARNGYHVTAFDIAVSGLEKGRRLAQAAGVHINFYQGDLLRHEPEGMFDVIYSTDVLEYVPAEHRRNVLCQWQAHTSVGGLDVLDVFVEKSFIAIAPDWEHGKEFFWNTGELFSYYASNWKIELIRESVFDCDSAGIPHKHCMDMMIARRMA